MYKGSETVDNRIQQCYRLTVAIVCTSNQWDFRDCQGCGVVEFETPDQAQEAIEKLTDTELKERKIFVREDREEDDRAKPRGTNSYRGGGGGYQRGGRGGYSRGGGGYGGGGYGYDYIQLMFVYV